MNVFNKDKPHLGGNIKGGDPRTFEPVLWDCLLVMFDVESVLDVGCGEGHALDYFKSKGIGRIVGVEGLRENVDNVRHECHHIDLTSGSYVSEEMFDLVWCCELVEHVDERFVGNVVETLANGRVVAMTHAIPGQSGHHHVNCKNDEYWIDLMRGAGYGLSRKETAYCRTLSKHYFNKSGLIFRRAVT